MAELPLVPDTRLFFIGMAGIKTQIITQVHGVVSGLEVVRLIAVREGVHTVAARINGLTKNERYRITAWVRPLAGANFGIAARDQPDNSDGPNNGRAIFDLAKQSVLRGSGKGQPGLDDPRGRAVVERVREKLLTPVGLRSLSPGHPDYKSRYDGDLRARDAAYHQGTVWAWLIGPFVDAWLRVNPEDRAGARAMLDGFEKELAEACIGTISEVFNAEAPYHPRGCAAQAWSVAEVLRSMHSLRD